MVGLWSFTVKSNDFDELGSENYHVREAATKAIKGNITDESHLELLRIERTTHDAEVRYRCRNILLEYYASLLPKGEQWPWLDCLPDDYPNRERICLRLPELDPFITDWVDPIAFDCYRDETWQFICVELDNGMTGCEAADLLWRMIQNEKQWVDVYKNRAYEPKPEFKH
jgi:hypothetical protein